ncbi:hypothetical protein ABPG73_008674 [Tetrahymena malaccensis]
MGNVIKQLGNTSGDSNVKTKNSILMGQALSKLREYHGSFKSVCDTFAIEQNEFDQILGQPDKSQELFQLWDRDKNGLIDALELFSGLILFSEAKFEDKLRFLFDIFDFNELNSLSIIDLEFMMISCCNATFKMLDISESEVNEEDITEFLGKNFNDDSRVNISQMLKWCAKTPEIREFMLKIKKLPPENKNQKNQHTNNLLLDSERVSTFQETKSLGAIINSKKYQQKLDWLSTFSKKLQYLNQSNSKTSQKDAYCKINWVYGFRSQNVNHPLEYIAPSSSAESERILYFTACIVVIFYPQIKIQRHYIEHDKEVNCLAVAKKKHLVASGELGDKPHLHIWDPNTLQNLGVIKGIHQRGIILITFFRDDEFIASCGSRLNSPILIHSLKDYSLVLSTFVDEPVIELLTIRNYIGQFSLNHSNKKYNPQFKPVFSTSKNPQNKKDVRAYLVKQENQLSIYESMIEDFQNSFIVCTSRKILMLHYQNGHFQKAEINLNKGEENQQISDITCAAALRLNDEQPYLKAFQKEEDSCIVIITGHSDGQIYMWRNMDESENEKINIEEETREKSQAGQNSIVCIVTYQYGIIVATGASMIYLFDLKMKQPPIQKIELTTFPFKLFNYDIADILVAVDKLLISTIYGDIIEIKLNQKQEWQSNKFIMKTHANRLNYITKLNGNLNAMCILERPENDDKILFVAGQSSVVYGFSLETHEIVDIWTIGQEKPITAMDCVNFEDGGTVFAIGCDNGQIYMRIDWEESPKSYDCKKMILDLKFSSDTFYLIAACSDNQVYLFSLSNNSYFQVNPKKLSLEEVPIYIHFLDDNKSFIIGTNQRQQYKVEIPDLKSKNIQQENEKLNCTIWNLRYPLHTKNYVDSMLPIIIGADIKVFLAAGESGYLYYWRDQEQLESNCGGFLKGHSSQISRLLMTKSQDLFFSLGSKDNSIIEWKVDFINDYNDFSKPFKEDNNSALSNLEIVSKVAQLKDDILVRELSYSYIGKNNFISDTFRDTFVLFKGTEQKILQNLNIQEEFEKKYDLQMKRPPPLSLELDFVYGFQAFDKRKTLHYAHIYYDKDFQFGVDENGNPIRKSKYSYKYDILKNLSRHRNILGFQKHKNTSITQQPQNNTLQLSYDQPHENCQRLFVYFCSRIGIVYDPVRNKQIFYEGHKSKISCLVVHPLKYLVATGEASSKPTIHVWNVLNCEPFKILSTFHKNGIINMAFSNQSSLIVSVGMDINFSLQVTNWKTEEIIALRNSGQYHIFDVCFNPYNRYEFVTCGTQNITVWEMNGRNILRKLVVNAASESDYGANCCITCVDYISYYINESIDYDIIAGNNFGDLILITCNKYVVARNKAHLKMINCIKIFKAFEEHILIITAGEDELIKIWDTKFNLINEIKIKQIPEFSYLSSSQTNTKDLKNLSAQSIDIYFCGMHQQLIEQKLKSQNSKLQNTQQSNKKKEEQTEKQWPIILFGTRNGAIMEATFQLDEASLKINNNDEFRNNLSTVVRRDQKQEESDDSEDEQENNKIQLYGQSKYFKNFRFSEFLQFHSNQTHHSQTKQNLYENIFNKKVYFALHPQDQIMVTVGEDGLLCMFDLTNDKPLLIKHLQNTPSCVKFCPFDGNILVIGFTNGCIRFFSSIINKSKFGKKHERYEAPQLDVRQIVDDGKTAVLNIEFSDDGQYMAASYDNSRQSKEQESKFEKEGSFIQIFKSKQRLGGIASNKKDNANYQKYIEIKCPSVYESYRTDSNAYGCAVYFMTFSINDDFLLIYYQLVDNYLVRINHDQQGHYMIWDIKNNQAVKLWENIQSIKWQKLNFPNSLKAQYQYYPQLLIADEISKDTLSSNIGPLGSNVNQQLNTAQGAQIVGNNAQVPYISVMLDLKPYLICGSIKGDLHLVKQTCLMKDKDGKEGISQNIVVRPDQMCLAKSYSSHVSFVNQCERTIINGNKTYLFTSGITDESIFKWKLKEEDQYWDLDNLTYKLDQPDIFAELVTKDKFSNLQNEVLPQRQETAETCSQIEDTKESPVELKLSNIIGRKSFNRYNNLFYDYDENILYLAGCNLVILKSDQFDEQNSATNQNLDEKQSFLQLKQEFVKLDASINSSFPQLSCFSLSEDKKFLVAGTIETQAKLIIWDICSRTCIKTLRITNSPMILKAKFAHDNKHIGLVALTNDYTMCVYLIDSQSGQVLGCANFPYSLPYKIKDLAFLPNSIYQFITCGIQNMSHWKFNGSILSYHQMEIENPPPEKDLKKNNDDVAKDDANREDYEKEEEANEEEEEPTKLKVSFLCIIFVQDVIITSGEDGYLYVWEENKIKKKHPAHKLTIGTLFAKRESNLFVSGSLDGRVCLWEIFPSNYNYEIIKIQEYSITNLQPDLVLKKPEFQIQSICIGSKYILAGTKSGDIYELLLPQYSEEDFYRDSSNPNVVSQQALAYSKEEGEDQDEQHVQLMSQPKNSRQNQINLRISCHDQEIPLSLGFSDDSKYLYSITQKGFFCVWDVQTLKRIFFKFFNKDTQGLIVCKQSSKIYIAFDNEIQILKNDIYARKSQNSNTGLAATNQNLGSYNNMLRPQMFSNNNFEKLTPFSFESLKSQPLDSTISDMKLSKGEKLLAVAIQNKINIYSPVGDETSPNLKLLCTISNLASPVEYIDFTEDDNFLLYKDTLEEVSIIDLSNQKKINTIFIEHDIEWCSDGIKIGEKTKGVHSHYSDENKILKITPITTNCIAVTDEMGTIRLFNYPCDSGTGNGYMRCYPDHLNNVNQCVLSPDKRFLVTSSERDRCIFIWTVIEISNQDNEYDGQNDQDENGEDEDRN